ncbi:MAG TPA: hypothetical protein VGL03_01615 [Thermoanaerobaculia bacterium]|jgi:hypothetical protein
MIRIHRASFLVLLAVGAVSLAGARVTEKPSPAPLEVTYYYLPG